MKFGLVLEGGGLRGVYTVGVLDAFLERGRMADYVVGVSAGAANGVSYVSRQKGRGLRTNLDYLKDPRYMGLRSLLLHRSLFGLDFIFGEIPAKLDPFDYEAFQQNPCQFKAGAIDVETGETVYFDKSHMRDNVKVLQASSSLPVLSPIVEYGGYRLLDGGVSDPIPVRQALADGCTRVAVVLTRAWGYRKKPQSFRPVYRRVYRQYPSLVRALETRHLAYNETLDFLARLQWEGKAAVIAPASPPQVGRVERNREKLLALYREGRRDGEAFLRSGFWPE